MAPTSSTSTATETAAARRADGEGVGAMIRRRRNALGLSQLGLAIQAGCGEMTVFRIEAGSRTTEFTRRNLTDTLDELEAAA